jgi:Flp pilus assembly protein TadD
VYASYSDNEISMDQSPPTAEQLAALRRTRARRLVAGLLIGCALVLAIYWFNRPQDPAAVATDDDPRLTFSTPYRNVHPDVKYVGDAACTRCHAGRAATYRQHPMGRSLGPVSQVAVVERYDETAQNPFTKLGRQFLVERLGERVVHKERRHDSEGRLLTDSEAEVHYAVGSGRHGRTYLIDRDGYLYQSLISWYAQKGIWDLTPGFQVAEHFERPAQPDCLFCHSNQVVPVPHTVNRYQTPIFRGHAIGCERCHGPGELHVRLHEAEEAVDSLDHTIVNPRRLTPALRDAVCEQCHLHGETRIVRRRRKQFDYRPGLPLHLFHSVFMRKPEFAERTIGSHTEQMYQSRCYQASKGKLGCICCHDPHVSPAPAERVTYYRNRCLNCHEEQSCGLPVAVRRMRNPADSCSDCHMPRADSKIVHTAVTDHRIVRQASQAAGQAASPRNLFPGEIPLFHFHRDLVDSRDAGVSRDLGLALMELSKSYPNLGPGIAAAALPLLNAAVAASPTDVPAAEARGFLLWQSGRREEALAAFETVLARAPERELTLTYAAVLAALMDRNDAALAYWRRAIKVNRWNSQYHQRFAKLLADHQEWPEALKECEAALRLNPASEEVRMVLITCSLRTGQKERAEAEFDRLLRMRPADREELRRWFAELMQ